MTDLARARLRALAEAAQEAAPGPWFYDTHSSVESEPLCRSRVEAENDLLDDAPDAVWDGLPDPHVCSVQTRHGDTASERGRAFAEYIAAASPGVVLALLEELESGEPRVLTLGGAR